VLADTGGGRLATEHEKRERVRIFCVLCVPNTETSGKTISAQRDLVRPPDALGHPGTFKALKVSKVPAGTSALVTISHRGINRQTKELSKHA